MEKLSCVWASQKRGTGGSFFREMKNKVPQVTLAFWLIKICATTLGETGGDAVSMSMDLGYKVSTAIFFALFLVAVIPQIAAKSYHRFLYWAVIVTTTTVGTTMSDFLTRTAGLGYLKTSILLFAIVMGILAIWYFVVGSISVARIIDKKAEAFYWLAILFSNTLGTAMGDALSDAPGFGFAGGAFTFGGALVLIALAYFFTKISHTALFWAAFILTRPLGATLGDLLTKPHDDGGLDLSRGWSSLVIVIAMIVGILWNSRKNEESAQSEATPAS
jgi:uncharacterized membrane-anchored protein